MNRRELFAVAVGAVAAPSIKPVRAQLEEASTNLLPHSGAPGQHPGVYFPRKRTWLIERGDGTLAVFGPNGLQPS